MHPLSSWVASGAIAEYMYSCTHLCCTTRTPSSQEAFEGDARSKAIHRANIANEEDMRRAAVEHNLVTEPFHFLPTNRRASNNTGGAGASHLRCVMDANGHRAR